MHCRNLAQNASKSCFSESSMSELEVSPTPGTAQTCIAARSWGRPHLVNELQNREIDHFGSTATSEPPLLSALAGPSPALVVEKQQLRVNFSSQDLRCENPHLLHSLHCACTSQCITGKSNTSGDAQKLRHFVYQSAWTVGTCTACSWRLPWTTRCRTQP